jgi:hypothetical protein
MPQAFYRIWTNRRNTALTLPFPAFKDIAIRLLLLAVARQVYIRSARGCQYRTAVRVLARRRGLFSPAAIAIDRPRE